MIKKLIGLGLVLCMVLSCVTSIGFTASEKAAQATGTDTKTSSIAADYQLPQSCKDGNILQCFNWTLSQIKAELPHIAEAGFTSVQTSPLQAHNGYNQWYWLYQPNGFSVGNELGSYDDLKALCAEADKYGIKIIVDVVANHLAGSNNGTWANSIDSALKQSKYFHNLGPCSNYDNRYDVTHKNIGMPDLNSENTDIQNMVYAMAEKLKSAGVDGIRWDAAKHISLPSENCAFWSKMAQLDLYQYGEILEAPAGNSSDSINNPLMAEYAQYMNVTDSKYSSAVMSAVRDATIYKTTGYWNKRNIGSDQLVYWAESHDTYANEPNDGGWTKSLDQNTIDRAYAILGARADSQTLYLSRPSEKNHQSIYYGKKGSTHFTSKEIAAVNHFHNAMIGKDEKYYTNANCYIVSRSAGAVIVSMEDADVDVSVTNSGSLVPSGTYTDEVFGTTWTVTDKKITGHIGSSGIAVIYDPNADTKETLLGDTDGDDQITILDATAIQRRLADQSVVAFNEIAADADEDGDITIMDATQIQRHLAQLTCHEAIGKPIT